MRDARPSDHVLSISLIASLLAGCGASVVPINAPETMPQAFAHGHFKVLHRFTGSDGASPSGPLLDVNGTLYGVTSYGGKHGYGTVYSISFTGAEKVIYSFKGGTDGSGPAASLIDVNGTLYGITAAGGGSGCLGYGCGTVYSVTTNGKEKVLHRFTGGSDGVSPDSTLLRVRGLLYGTTETGGSSKAGIVYRVEPVGLGESRVRLRLRLRRRVPRRSID